VSHGSWPEKKRQRDARQQMRRGTWHRQMPVSEECGKIRFRSRDTADRELRRAIERSEAKGTAKVQQRSYECDACGWWHHTSMTEDEYAALSRRGTGLERGTPMERRQAAADHLRTLGKQDFLRQAAP
jgi:hypothetical protein